MFGIFHHVIAINTIILFHAASKLRKLPPFVKTGTVPAITITNPVIGFKIEKGRAK
jgi:hypothetical protein